MLIHRKMLFAGFKTFIDGVTITQASVVCCVETLQYTVVEAPFMLIVTCFAEPCHMCTLVVTVLSLYY